MVLFTEKSDAQSVSVVDMPFAENSGVWGLSTSSLRVFLSSVGSNMPSRYWDSYSYLNVEAVSEFVCGRKTLRISAPGFLVRQDPDSGDPQTSRNHTPSHSEMHNSECDRDVVRQLPFITPRCPTSGLQILPSGLHSCASQPSSTSYATVWCLSLSTALLLVLMLWI